MTNNTATAAHTAKTYNTAPAGFCRCNCGQTVGKKATYRPGHDATHVSLLLADMIEHDEFDLVELYKKELPSDALRSKFQRAADNFQAKKASKKSAQADVVIEYVDVFGHVAKLGRWTYPVRAVRITEGGKLISETFERNTARDRSGEWREVEEALLVDA